MSKQPESSEQKSSDKGSNLTSFVGETKEELGKVAWPSRQQLLSESTAVILMVILVATVIYLVDNFFAWGSGKVF
ncbi:preprotein translocase subunit SecE [Xenococcus sp. PCC 7305]|uniref:preprotein translocase subunit SecE n=1 Tax=Xenococcus sp. PCC 7305 TaxID=102125 RepID=UPI0006903CF7